MNKLNNCTFFTQKCNRIEKYMCLAYKFFPPNVLIWNQAIYIYLEKNWNANLFAVGKQSFVSSSGRDASCVLACFFFTFM